MKFCNIFVAAALVSSLTGTACVSDVESGTPPPGPAPSTGQLNSNVVCTLGSAATGFAAGAAVTLATSTGVCAVGMSVTVYGEAFCAVPAAGTALAAVAAVLSGSIAWATCNTWVGPVVQNDTTRANGCVEGNERFCRNLNWRYKNACGQDQFSELGNCFGMDSCNSVHDMLWRAASCKRGRQLMGDACYGSIDAGHQEAIDHANNVVYDCSARAAQLECDFSQGISASELARHAAENIVHQAYLCK
jgi:hypothetical protein